MFQNSDHKRFMSTELFKQLQLDPDKAAKPPTIFPRNQHHESMLRRSRNRLNPNEFGLKFQAYQIRPKGWFFHPWG